jgi:hypothetical protein
MNHGWTRLPRRSVMKAGMNTDAERQSPGGTPENSPPFQRWGPMRKPNESRQGRQNPVWFSGVFFRPSGALGILGRVNPAINRWAIFACPCGTKTIGGGEK